MPRYDLTCRNEQCPDLDVIREITMHMDESEPACRCGQQMVKVPVMFAMPFSGDITSRYNDKRLEGGHKKSGAHWVYERNTPDGKPKPRLIRTFAEQADYCRREGLVNPREAGPAEISSDGRTVTSVGLPGCEI